MDLPLPVILTEPSDHAVRASVQGGPQYGSAVSGSVLGACEPSHGCSQLAMHTAWSWPCLLHHHIRHNGCTQGRQGATLLHCSQHLRLQVRVLLNCLTLGEIAVNISPGQIASFCISDFRWEYVVGSVPAVSDVAVGLIVTPSKIVRPVLVSNPVDDKDKQSEKHKDKINAG